MTNTTGASVPNPSHLTSVSIEHLESEAGSLMARYGFYVDSGYSDDVLLKKWQIAMLATLLKELAPSLEGASAPADFAWGALIRDLQLLLTDEGRPQILWTPASNGEKWLKDDIRKAFVLGVMYQAAREKIGAPRIIDRLDIGMTDNTWKSWKRSFTKPADRTSATNAGKSGDPWSRATDDASLTKLYSAGFGQKLPHSP